MPFVSRAQEKWAFATKQPFAKKWADMTSGKLPTRKKKFKISVNNKLKEYGNEQGGKIEINVAKHRGDKAELADTIHHELLHKKHPKASEENIKKKTKIDMSKMSYAEKEALTRKLRTKKLNYQGGALKRKFKMGRGKVEPGAFIKQLNNSKLKKKTDSSSGGLSREKLSIMGLI